MNAQAIMTVAAAVVALTQLLKWSDYISDRRGPIAVLILSLIGIVFWAWSSGDFTRATAFSYFAGWIAVSTAAAGVFGFTRAAPAAVTSATPPPASGAGSNPTT